MFPNITFCLSLLLQSMTSVISCSYKFSLPDHTQSLLFNLMRLLKQKWVQFINEYANFNNTLRKSFWKLDFGCLEEVEPNYPYPCKHQYSLIKLSYSLNNVAVFCWSILHIFTFCTIFTLFQHSTDLVLNESWLSSHFLFKLNIIIFQLQIMIQNKFCGFNY